MNEGTGKAILLFVILVAALGFWGAIGLVGDILELFINTLIELNRAVYESFGESILSGMFKHFMTYKIVGLILSTGIAGGSAFLGKWIGKISYIIVGFGVVAMLNFVAILL